MPKTPSSYLFRGLCIVVALILIIMVAIYAKNSLAGLYEKYTRQYISLWSKNPRAFSANQWQKALNYASTAYKLNPKDPFNHERLGLVHEFGELLSDISSGDKITHYTSAKIYYLSAIKLRPASGWDRARLFRIKIKLGELDDQAVAAMAKAIELTPRNNYLMLKAILPALAVKDHTKIDELRAKATNQVLTSKRHYRQLYSLYKSYNREDELCQLMATKNIVSTFKNGC